MDRGQTDIDRLFYLVAGVVAFLVIVPAVAGVAGFDIRNGSLVGDQSQDSESEGLRILSAYGTEIDDDRSSLGVVEIIVTASDGSDIDITGATVSWDGAEQYELTPTGVDVGDASFSVSGDTELTGTADRAILRFDLGSDDLSDADRFGDRLEPGQTIEVSIETDDGNTVTRTLDVPNPLPPGSGVSLF
jgi:archaellin